jgi:DNA-binding transcriptional LysR family regulator
VTGHSYTAHHIDLEHIPPSTWRLADLSTKHAFVKDGAGWGSMPWHMVESDIAAGSLVSLDVREGFTLTMSACYRASAPPGPAGRRFIDYLKGLSGDVPENHESNRLPASQKNVRASRRSPNRA